MREDSMKSSERVGMFCFQHTVDGKLKKGGKRGDIWKDGEIQEILAVHKNTWFTQGNVMSCLLHAPPRHRPSPECSGDFPAVWMHLTWTLSYCTLHNWMVNSITCPNPIFQALSTLRVWKSLSNMTKYATGMTRWLCTAPLHPCNIQSPDLVCLCCKASLCSRSLNILLLPLDLYWCHWSKGRFAWLMWRQVICMVWF